MGILESLDHLSTSANVERRGGNLQLGDLDKYGNCVLLRFLEDTSQGYDRWTLPIYSNKVFLLLCLFLNIYLY